VICDYLSCMSWMQSSLLVGYACFVSKSEGPESLTKSLLTIGLSRVYQRASKDRLVDIDMKPSRLASNRIAEPDTRSL
jgi:hypothetical protein